MTNPFKYDKAKNEIWEDYPAPNKYEYGSTLTELRRFENTLANYNTRPHFTVSPEPDWEDGKIVEEKTHFVFEHWCNNQETLKGRPEKVSIVTYQEFQNMKVRKCPSCYLIAIPLPKENYGIL